MHTDQHLCESCARFIPPRKRRAGSPRRFCSVACRQAAWRRSRKVRKVFERVEVPVNVQQLPPDQVAIASALEPRPPEPPPDPIAPSRQWIPTWDAPTG